MNTPVKWAAEPAHVREVSLLGTADLAFWKDRLMKEDLLPAESDGQAQLLIVAADSKFMGVRFRERSFSVLVSRQEEGTRQDAAYLVRAFNSCRLFAFCERVFFATPYNHGDVRVSASFSGRRWKPMPPGWEESLRVAETMAGKGPSSCPKTGAGKVARATCSLPDSEAIPRRIRSFLPRTR